MINYVLDKAIHPLRRHKEKDKGFPGVHQIFWLTTKKLKIGRVASFYQDQLFLQKTTNKPGCFFGDVSSYG